MDQQLVLDAVEAVGERLGDPDFEVTSIHVNPAAETVVVDARGLEGPDSLDGFTVHRGRIRSVAPKRVSVSDDLDEEAFSVSEVHLDRLDQMVEQAHEGFASEGSWVEYVSIRAEPTEDRTRNEPVVRVQLESDRSAAEARFSADGRLLELELR